MIRINLLGGERQKAKSAARFDASQQLTAMCGLVVVAAVCGVGFWYWKLGHEATQLDAQIVSLKREAARLDSVMAEVKTFEDRKATLQQRVALIERLRQGQTVPVQLLDHVSRSLPEMLWLTDLREEGDFLTIEGRTTTLIGLSDFVNNLGTNPVARLFADAFVMLLSGNRAGLEKIFKMQLTPKAGGAPGASADWKLLLTPRVAPMDKLIKEMELRGRGLNLNELDVREASGDWTRTSFSDVDLNRRYTPAEQAKFFTLPKK